NIVTGRFDLLDFQRSGDTVTSLWLTYEQHCRGDMDALFGEVRYGAPREGALRALSSRVSWPDTYPNLYGQLVPVVPITVVSGPGVNITSVALTGQQFRIRGDSCSGQTLPPGGACT